MCKLTYTHVRTYICKHANLFEVPEQFSGGAPALHGGGDDALGQGLGAARLPNQEQRDPQLHTDGHHEHVLSERCVPCNVGPKLHVVQKHILTAGTQDYIK